MKIICDTKLLTSAVMNVYRAIPIKSTIPIIEGILISAEDDGVRLCGYDLEMGITTKIKAKVLEKGSIVLNAKLFADIVRKMPQDEITISCKNKNMVEIISGMSQFSLSGMNASEYPTMPNVEDCESIQIGSGIIKNMISQTLFAVAVSDSKPVHMGSLIECKDSLITIVSVDGIRLALRTEKLTCDKQISIVVPGKTLSEIPKLITDDETMITINVSNKHVIFQIEDYTVISRLLEGEFLDYKTAIPAKHSTEVKVKTKDMINSIERTSLIIFDKLKAPIKLALDNNLIRLSCNSTTGDSYDELVCSVEGNLFEIGFNSKMLLDALKVIDDEEIKILLSGPLSPMIIVPTEGDRFIFLILPVRLKNNEYKTNN